MGLCLPKECSQSELKLFEDGIKALMSMVGVEGTIKMVVTEDNVYKTSTGNVIGFIGFGVLGLIMIMGLLVEYTSIFGGSGLGAFDK